MRPLTGSVVLTVCFVFASINTGCFAVQNKFSPERYEERRRILAEGEPEEISKVIIESSKLVGPKQLSAYYFKTRAGHTENMEKRRERLLQVWSKLVLKSRTLVAVMVNMGWGREPFGKEILTRVIKDEQLDMSERKNSANLLADHHMDTARKILVEYPKLAPEKYLKLMKYEGAVADIRSDDPNKVTGAIRILARGGVVPYKSPGIMSILKDEEIRNHVAAMAKSFPDDVLKFLVDDGMILSSAKNRQISNQVANLGLEVIDRPLDQKYLNKVASVLDSKWEGITYEIRLRLAENEKLNMSLRKNLVSRLISDACKDPEASASKLLDIADRKKLPKSSRATAVRKLLDTYGNKRPPELEKLAGRGVLPGDVELEYSFKKASPKERLEAAVKAVTKYSKCRDAVDSALFINRKHKRLIAKMDADNKNFVRALLLMDSFDKLANKHAGKTLSTISAEARKGLEAAGATLDSAVMGRPSSSTGDDIHMRIIKSEMERLQKEIAPIKNKLSRISRQIISTEMKIKNSILFYNIQACRNPSTFNSGMLMKRFAMDELKKKGSGK